MISLYQKVCILMSFSSLPSIPLPINTPVKPSKASRTPTDTTPNLATVQKIIAEILPASSGQAFAKDARDLLIECCVEFITLISSEANEIAEKETKKTIACEHVTKALEDLGFPDYVPEVLKAAGEHKEQMKVGWQAVASAVSWNSRLMTGQNREKKQSKLEQSGLSDAELLRQQEELFGAARNKYAQGPA
jgi:histone H3/H4